MEAGDPSDTTGAADLNPHRVPASADPRGCARSPRQEIDAPEPDSWTAAASFARFLGVGSFTLFVLR